MFYGDYRCTVYWLKDMISGKRKYVHNSAVKVCFAPQYEGLTVSVFLEKAFSAPGVREYFPEDRDIHRLPRYWVLNVAYSCLGNTWKDFVDNLVNTRHESLKVAKGLTIEMDPTIAEIFQRSTAVSSR